MTSFPRWRAFVQWGLIGGLALSWSLRPRALPAYETSGEVGADTRVYASLVAANAPAPDMRTESGPKDSAIVINWSVLRGLQYRSGTMSDTLRKLSGKRVRVPGFIVPLEDYQQEAKEFLLVPYFGACVHEPPPPPNQMVYVGMKGGTTKISLFDPVWIEGVMVVSKYQSIYGAAGFKMTADRIIPYRRPGE